MLKYILFIFFLISITFYGITRPQNTTAYLPENAHITSKTSPDSANLSGYRGYDLVYQRLRFEINPQVQYIKGSVTSRFTRLENFKSPITFDMHDSLNVDSVIYHGQRHDFTHKNNTLTIPISENFVPYKTDSLTIYYQGKPVSKNFGSFMQGTHDGIPIIWTLSEPYGAKDWFPCKQALIDKIDSVDIYITHPAEYEAASNGVRVSRKKHDSLATTHWRHRHPIATYLIAITVTNYKIYSHSLAMDSGDSLEIVNYVYPENYNQVKEQTRKIIPVIQLFNELFIPYPFKNEKYGHAQFGWGGGMEHQTMSFMGNFTHELMAHELAHQWFGNYITCGSWKDIWLNEGFAVYLTGLTYKRMFSKERWHHWLEELSKHIRSKPGGSVIVDDTTSVMRIFNGRLTYNKSGYILHMIRGEIGDENFFQALQNYLTDSSLINNFARTKDLRKHFEATSDRDLKEFFDDWVYGEGYPVYDIKWSQSENNILHIEVAQDQSHESSDFFEMHLQFHAKGKDRDTLISVHNTENDQHFYRELDFKVDTLIFNPDLHVLTEPMQPASVNWNKGNKKIEIHPNPVEDHMRIMLPHISNLNFIKIYNSEGQEIIDKDIKNTKYPFVINTNNLKGGLYVLKLKANREVFQKKFIKID